MAPGGCSLIPDLVLDFLRAGGKRLMPVLCALGRAAGGGTSVGPGIVRVGAVLEMFHAFALIHGDLSSSEKDRA